MAGTLTLPIYRAAGGHWSLAVSLGSRALQSPSRQRFADFSASCMMAMWGLPTASTSSLHLRYLPSRHNCNELYLHSIFTLASNIFRLQRA